MTRRQGPLAAWISDETLCEALAELGSPARSNEEIPILGAGLRGQVFEVPLEAGPPVLVKLYHDAAGPFVALHRRLRAGSDPLLGFLHGRPGYQRTLEARTVRGVLGHELGLLVLSFVPGERLDEVLRKPGSLARGLDLLGQLIDRLALAWAEGFRWWDVRGNAIVDPQDRVVLIDLDVLDFSLAEVEQGRGWRERDWLEYVALRESGGLTRDAFGAAYPEGARRWDGLRGLISGCEDPGARAPIGVLPSLLETVLHASGAATSRRSARRLRRCGPWEDLVDALHALGDGGALDAVEAAWRVLRERVST